ncbi:MAG: hypothetical protein IJV88_06555 [Ruminococcus sp.]|nr:hypothetical protein [Ruminococcus sp.]
MEKTATPDKKKTGRLITKNIIVMLVLVAAVVLSIWAWFTMGQTAFANGIELRANADGVQVSWDGKNFYDNLTELDKSKLVPEEVGPALNVNGSEEGPLPLKLITGNGLSFFEPYLNRRTGDVILNSDGTWQGIEITDENSHGRYVDVDLYFRGNTARNIYLAGDSVVSPKTTDTTRYSDFGPFSKDYIAAASRVAFMDADKKNVSFIWAPNADVELVENNAGYSIYNTTRTEDVTISGGGTTNIDGGVVDDGKTYYFWTYWDNSVVSEYPSDLSKFEARQFEYDSERRYFVTDVTMYLPTYSNNPSIPVFINETSSAAASNINQYNQYIDGAASKNLNKEAQGQFFGVTNTSFNVGSSNCSNAMYLLRPGDFTMGSKIDFELGYDPVNKLLVVLSYTVEGGGSFDLGGQESDITISQTYFPLNNNVNCALVNPADSAAVSSGENYKKAVNFTNANKTNVKPISITTAEQFTAVKTGDGYSATYKFKNAKTNTYLTVSNGSVSFSGSGTSFSLYYSTEHTGPILKAGDYYLVLKNGQVCAVKAGELEFADVITIYTGSSYKLNTGLNSDIQPYQFYNYQKGTLDNLETFTTPPLFSSFNGTEATVKIGNTPIATLTKANASDEYYTAHIVMRIWVEGTDREAKTPLADGIFDASFHFVSQ